MGLVMNSWVLRQNLLGQMITHRTGDAAYFLFDRELATTENSVVLLVRSVTAAAKALGVRNKLELHTDELIRFAKQARTSKLLLKCSCKGDRAVTEIFERD